MQKDVFLALLAMDAYNRGYDPNIAGLSASPGKRIGNSRILKDADDPDGIAQSVGFYSIAYSVNGVSGIADGTKVISYRGTNFDLNGGFSSPAALDILNGWSFFTGIGTNAQAGLAQQFFTAVTGAGFPSGQAVGPGNTILTGHSLGGGLAANDNRDTRRFAA